MDTLRKFSFRNSEWICSVDFFSDRVEYFWNRFGMGAEKGQMNASRSELATHVVDSIGPSRGYGGTLRLAGVYLVFSIFSYLLLPLPWRYLACLFLGLFILSLFFLAYAMRSKHWIIILKKNRSVFLTIEASKWTKEQREEFHHFYAHWMSSPTHTFGDYKNVEATASSPPEKNEPTSQPWQQK